MATFSRHVASVGNAASYQVSGIPWISGSSMAINDGSLSGGADDPAEIRFQFPRVTKSVTVLYAAGSAGTPTNGTQHGSDTAGLRIHFNSTGSGNVLSERHFVELNEVNESMTFVPPAAMSNVVVNAHVNQGSGSQLYRRWGLQN